MQHSKSGFAGRHRSFRWLHRSVLRLALFSFVSICLKISPGGHSMAFANDSAPEISSELKNLQTKASKHPSFKVKFEQTVFSALRKKSTKSEGELIFAQPRKFRWEILSPFRELYVNNGEWFWKYVETTKHALRLPATAGELDFLDVIFQLDKLQNKYRLQRIKLLSDVNGMPADGCPQSHTCIALQPLQKGPQSNIELAISQLNGFVSTVRIDFRNGNRTLISFSSFKGENVNSKVFEFTPPAGTAVDKR
jgi:outer membrane lipoprotein-sorting protein